MFNFFKKNEKLENIEAVIKRSNRGIKKRIDENRELVEFLLEEAPELVKEKSWVLNWLSSQDAFLVDLMNASEVELNPNEIKRGYPRPIPDAIKPFY